MVAYINVLKKYKEKILIQSIIIFVYFIIKPIYMSDFVLNTLKIMCIKLCSKQTYMIKFDAKARATIYMCERGGRCVTLNYFLFEFSVFLRLFEYIYA